MKIRTIILSLPILALTCLTACGVEPTPQKVFYADTTYFTFSDGDDVWSSLTDSYTFQTEAYRSNLDGSLEFGIGANGFLNRYWQDTIFSIELTIKNFTDEVGAIYVTDDNTLIHFKLFEDFDRKVFDHYAEVGEILITAIDTFNGKRWIFGEFTAELDSREVTSQPRIIKGSFDSKFSQW